MTDLKDLIDKNTDAMCDQIDGITARVKEIVAQRDELKAALREIKLAFVDYIDWNGAVHVGDCPGDDTCNCRGKSCNDAVQAALDKADAILGAKG